MGSERQWGQALTPKSICLGPHLFHAQWPHLFVTADFSSQVPSPTPQYPGGFPQAQSYLEQRPKSHENTAGEMGPSFTFLF